MALRPRLWPGVLWTRGSEVEFRCRYGSCQESGWPLEVIPNQCNARRICSEAPRATKSRFHCPITAQFAVTVTHPVGATQLTLIPAVISLHQGHRRSAGKECRNLCGDSFVRIARKRRVVDPTPNA